ncbi:disulfide reductase TlpA-like family [Candidatus Termititenax persephonae]|uniref:Disulfide reductase TlpA-like family n=1 Tax=Candidatus Termititenax persephonae TaxID=2218525 RepID=A0A388TH26_9BACT|nr:disulfide reductase TlpA-like family [Candidatus Termititenax persephonae]
MRKIFLIFCLIALSLAAGDKAVRNAAVVPEISQAFAAANVPILRQPSPAVDFTVSLADGGVLNLQDLSGQVVVLNFWASWCAPCRQEMPSMERLYQRLRPQGLAMLAINYQERPEDVRAFMTKNKLAFPAGLDSAGRLAALYGITAFPTTYIIDRQGRIVARVLGSMEWDTPEIIAALDALLRQK